jgi:hypothetical protein
VRAAASFVDAIDLNSFGLSSACRITTHSPFRPWTVPQPWISARSSSLFNLFFPLLPLNFTLRSTPFSLSCSPRPPRLPMSNPGPPTDGPPHQNVTQQPPPPPPPPLPKQLNRYVFSSFLPTLHFFLIPKTRKCDLPRSASACPSPSNYSQTAHTTLLTILYFFLSISALQFIYGAVPCHSRMFRGP